MWRVPSTVCSEPRTKDTARSAQFLTNMSVKRTFVQSVMFIPRTKLLTVVAVVIPPSRRKLESVMFVLDVVLIDQTTRERR